jgi:hypothetical protein
MDRTFGITTTSSPQLNTALLLLRFATAGCFCIIVHRAGSLFSRGVITGIAAGVVI